MSRLVDVSHEVEDGLATYPGLPSPVIYDFISGEESRSRYSEGTTLHIGRKELVSNTVTYVDAPVKFRAVGTFPVRAHGVVN